MNIENQIFERIESLELSKYEQCQFKDCNFEGQNFSNYKFFDCTFINCNLSLIKTDGLGIQDCIFSSCKLLGLQLHKLNTFNLGFSFENCTLDHSSFQNLNIKKTQFINCSLKEVDFEKTDLSHSKFENCNLERALFYQTNLEHTDFYTAYNYTIDPESNKLKGAKFSLAGIPGLLEKYKIKIFN